MFRGLLFIFFIVNIRTSSCAMEAPYEAGQRVWRLFTIIDKREWNITQHAETTESLRNNSMIREMEEQLNEIHMQLTELEEFMGPKKILNAIKSWPLSIQTIRHIDTIEIFVGNIDENYEKFNQNRNKSYRPVCSATDDTNVISQTLSENILLIRKFAINEEQSALNGKDLVAAIPDIASIHGAEICGAPQFMSNILIQLFRMIIIAELKTMTVVAYEIICRHVKNADNGLWLRENILARGEFEKYFAIYVDMFSLHMAVIDRVYNKACDPSGGNWTRNESFYELERTYQTTLFGYNSGDCGSKSCNYIKKQKTGGCQPKFYEELAFKNPEDIYTECAPLGYITACVLERGPKKIQYVNSTKFGFLGQNSSCPVSNGKLLESCTTPDGSFTACVCNSYSSHNKISLSMIESDVESNRVITGLRFVRRDDVLYIQSRQGKLGLNGYIKKHSQSWIAIPRTVDPLLIEPINRENGIFFLDDLTLPPNYVLTGIKFNKVKRGDKSGFAIEIFGTHFNYKTGQLKLGKDFTGSRQEKSSSPGKELLFKPVSSVFTTLPHTVTPSDTKYVSLKRSGLKEDFGQSTVPLFDGIPVIFEDATAFGGVGIFHKRAEGYAGLISLRVYGIQYERYFNDFKISHISKGRLFFNSSFDCM